MEETIEPIQEQYEVADSKEVIVSVIIGNEQGGNIAIALDGIVKEKGQTAIENYSLEQGHKLKNSILEINTEVFRINPGKKTVVTYIFAGGINAEPESFKSGEQEPGESERVFHNAEFRFI